MHSCIHSFIHSFIHIYIHIYIFIFIYLFVYLSIYLSYILISSSCICTHFDVPLFSHSWPLHIFSVKHHAPQERVVQTLRLEEGRTGHGGVHARHGALWPSNCHLTMENHCFSWAKSTNSMGHVQIDTLNCQRVSMVTMIVNIMVHRMVNRLLNRMAHVMAQHLG